ncbi:tRNA (guanine-N7-)-methyltransferase [Catalinimonas alkaloidigena]|uniref:tRNA (guanine-N(7)-)-methyltransferase n=1 Tax=Catalinimonas alkaloidigena TaxID=1075417 RepID=A0A1G9S3X7_9BACT|nr:tRNA (guanosine(46)-N7)-methyltransferase TrmB [Catalinimonas alkaloidigena]SDM30176.1 tRNA (guanine-N7-)-methyltransferase [Catalinimonas alkaloidigena]
MGRNKQQRFAANQANSNVLEAGKPLYETIKGQWHATQFKNEHPLVVELACGRGEYTVGLAREFPEKNFVGVDIKGARIWKGSTIAMQEGLDNVAFLRTRIEGLESFFAPGELREIWITFPDPRPRDRDIKRRLTSPRFLEMYRRLLPAEGWIHLKTDNAPLFDYTLEVLAETAIKDLVHTHDLYNSPYAADHKGIKTRYEEMFLAQGLPIHYLRFRFA